MKTLTKAQWAVIYLERRASKVKEANPDKNIFSDIIPMLNVMRRYERQMQRLAELDCNGYPRPCTEFRDGKMYRYDVEDLELKAKCEKKEDKLRSRIEPLAKEFNLTVTFQGDPRGNMFCLNTPDNQTLEVA